jgi:hypothetical protein
MNTRVIRRKMIFEKKIKSMHSLDVLWVGRHYHKTGLIRRTININAFKTLSLWPPINLPCNVMHLMTFIIISKWIHRPLPIRIYHP